MPCLTYVLPSGAEEKVDVPVGQSVMDGSVRNNLPGIVAECGGSCSCATCHVHLGGEARGHFDDPTVEELDLLEFLDGADEGSRLSCQLIVNDSCGGLRIHVADSR